VLLLEADGKDRDPAIHVPAGIVRLIGNPKVDWAHLAAQEASRDSEHPGADFREHPCGGDHDQREAGGSDCQSELAPSAARRFDPPPPDVRSTRP